jgi:hypothetical protein
MASGEKLEYLRTILITIFIVIVLFILVRYAFQDRVFLSDRAILEYLIESEEKSLQAAKLLQEKARDENLKKIAEIYIQRQTQSIQQLESLSIA